DATAGLLRQHLLDGELGDVQEALEVRRDERPEVLGRVVRERLGEEDAGVIDQCVNRLEPGERGLDDLGGRCRLADVAVHEGDWVGSRDLGGLGHLPGIGNDVETPLDKRVDASPAPIPCEAPVTMAVFRWLLMIGYLRIVLWNGSIDPALTGQPW